jgi:hypothetical protein
MTLHLIKLCVGCDSVDDLAEWLDERLATLRAMGRPAEHAHVTRMVPTRREALLEGGSLYWVIRGHVQVRQALRDIQPFEDEDGIRRCRLVLEPVLVPTLWQPRRPFQGWRYLTPKDAPAVVAAVGGADMPPALMAELAELGLL